MENVFQFSLFVFKLMRNCVETFIMFIKKHLVKLWDNDIKMDCGGIMLKLPPDNMVQLRDIFSL
jgi:hypothetical protein